MEDRLNRKSLSSLSSLRTERKETRSSAPSFSLSSMIPRQGNGSEVELLWVGLMCSGMYILQCFSGVVPAIGMESAGIRNGNGTGRNWKCLE